MCIAAQFPGASTRWRYVAKQEAHRRWGWVVFVGLMSLATNCPAQSPQTSQSPASAVSLNPLQRFAGTSSCLARGCHGGADVLADGTFAPVGLRNAATVWEFHDRHRRAYDTLTSAASREIVRRLLKDGALTSASSADDLHPEREQRCLACHTTPSLAASEWNSHAGVTALRGEGVSCDACHTLPGGNSQRWIDAHARGELAACYADPSRGLQPLSTSAQRAAVCAGCHVGAPADPEHGIPLRDMNHDLIAAGHPRLMFDYATFVQLLPPHWQERPDDQRHRSAADPTGEVASAVIGQTTVVQVQAALLGDRALRQQPWPEFSELDCYGCHHNLRGVSWRQSTPAVSRKGQPEWTGIAMLGPAARWLPKEESQAAALTELAQSLARFAPPPASAIERTRAWLAIETAVPADQPLPGMPATLEDLVPAWPQNAAVGDSQAKPSYVPCSWDESARRYYLLREVDRIHRRGRPVVSAEGQAADRALNELYEVLRLPRTPKIDNSPLEYDPQRVAESYNHARSLLLPIWSERLTATAVPR